MEKILLKALRKIWKIIPFAIRKKPISIAAASKIVHLYNSLDVRKQIDKFSELTETETAKFRETTNFISWPT